MNAEQSGTMRVLIVEDESRMRELLVEVLPRMGFTAAGARTAEEATRMMEAEPFDAMILDLQLPMMDGMTFLQKLRQSHPKLPVIILTGHGDLQAAKAAIHLDVVEFLTKPCHLGQIEVALDRARRRLEEARLEVERARVLEEEAEQEPSEGAPPPRTLAEHERKLILEALDRNRGNRTAAANELGISRRTLYNKLEEYQKGEKG